MIKDALIEEINSAYRQLSAATEDFASADRELAEHVRRVRLDNAETLIEAKNERTASLYLDGLLDTEEHRRLEDNRARAEATTSLPFYLHRMSVARGRCDATSFAELRGHGRFKDLATSRVIHQWQAGQGHR
jgi:hypothetical protein